MFVWLSNTFLKVVHCPELVRLKDLSLNNVLNTHRMRLESTEIFQELKKPGKSDFVRQLKNAVAIPPQRRFHSPPIPRCTALCNVLMSA